MNPAGIGPSAALHLELQLALQQALQAPAHEPGGATSAAPADAGTASGTVAGPQADPLAALANDLGLARLAPGAIAPAAMPQAPDGARDTTPGEPPSAADNPAGDGTPAAPRSTLDAALQAARPLATPAWGRAERSTGADPGSTERAHADAAPQDAASSLGAGRVADSGNGSSALLLPTILSALHPGPGLALRSRVEPPPEDANRQRPRGDPFGDNDDDEAPARGSDPAKPWREAAPGPEPEPLPPFAQASPWCHALVDALQREAREARAQQALHAAALQWLRGRCVLLACPQDERQPTLGWVCVLWRAASGEAPVLRGQRFPARLNWAHRPAAPRWWAVRAVKDHQAPRGRQLSTLADLVVGPVALAPGRVSCELQLGAVLPLVSRWQDLSVRVDAAQRFWTALGSQWSVHLLACSMPLMAEAADDPREAAR